jgi:hypothetical protein
LKNCDTHKYGDVISLYAKLNTAFGEIMKTSVVNRGPHERYENILKIIKNALEIDFDMLMFGLKDKYQEYLDAQAALQSPSAPRPSTSSLGGASRVAVRPSAPKTARKQASVPRVAGRPSAPRTRRRPSSTLRIGRPSALRAGRLSAPRRTTRNRNMTSRFRWRPYSI